MPGRHGGGPMGGGMGGGFRGGGMGGGFRGGGMPGGGFGGGWGGGWRPRGPWGGGYGFRRPFWGGFRGWFPWIPFMGYGGGYGYGGGGWGCGPAGCLILVLVVGAIIVFSSLGGGGGYRTYGYNGNTNANYNYSNDNSSGAPQLSDETGPVQTQTAQDLTELHQAFDSRIPTWENQLSANDEKSIPASDAGLTQDNNTQAVIYGKCGSGFYVYVVESTKPDNVPQANGEGYVYTTASSPGACHPKEYTVYQSEDVSGGWYFVYLQGTGSTGS